jgi:hypothetical protein
MRCLGLTGERRRCLAQAAGAVGYCDQHYLEMAPVFLEDKTLPRVGPAGFASFFHKLRPGSLRREIPDNARWDVPAWLKKGSTETVVEQLLRHPSSTVRWSAAFTLRKRRDPATIEPFWQALREDQFSLVRQQVAVALGKIGVPGVLGPLIEALSHDTDATVRQASAVALGNLGYSIAAQDLAAVLSREPAVFVRWDCVLALGQLGDCRWDALLMELANSERSEIIRQACRDAWTEIKRRKSVTPSA